MSHSRPTNNTRVSITRGYSAKQPPSILVHTHYPEYDSDSMSSAYHSSIVEFPPAPFYESSEESHTIADSPTSPLSTRKEAREIIRARGLTEEDRVSCPRSGCRRTSTNLKSFISHLDEHKIHDRSFKCPTCSHVYETKKEMAMHMCGGWPHDKSPRRSSFKAGITVLAKRFSLKA